MGRNSFLCNGLRRRIKAKKTHTNTTLERIAAVRWARHRDIGAIKIARINVLYVIRKRIQTIKRRTNPERAAIAQSAIISVQ
jgi:hypothetical protein